MLRISKANTKTSQLAAIPELSQYLTKGRLIGSVSLPPGKSCPNARTCRAHVETIDGKSRIIDGKFQTTRCFDASQSVIYKSKRLNEEHNFAELQAAKIGLECDHDDSHAALPSKRDQSFALVVHGVQPPTAIYKTRKGKAIE